MLTREEWQEDMPVPIDSVMEAECDLHDRDELIRLMGQIIYHQTKLIKNACSQDGSPRVEYTDAQGMEWQFAYMIDAYVYLTDELMPFLPKDWTTTLKV